MANNFCRFLSNGYRIKSDGTNLTYAPCCWYQKEISLINNPNFADEKNQISQITSWVPECITCKKIEDSGVYGSQSPRLRSFREIPDVTIPDNVPAWIELTIDTTCNAACIMCGPYHSTTWRKQELKFGIKRFEDLPDLIDPVVWLEKIKSMFTLKYVKSVSFLGGEPFESPIPLIFLKLLKEIHGSLRDVTIHFQTNCSLLPSAELIELMKECQLVKFNMSIDGVGKRLEYIRYPLKWERIENTIAYMKSLNLPNIKYIVLATLTPLNAYYYDELEDWVEKTLPPSDSPLLLPNRSYGKVDLNQTPVNLRKTIINKFGKDHRISKMFATLEFNTNSFIRIIEDLDQKRKTNWQKVFPEMVEYFDPPI
jgi:uncharacterized Fe-S cluster-containing radical SAM superfamily enzyme